MPLPWQRPQLFFFTTIHFLDQTYQAIKKIWLCFVLSWGGVTPISRPLLENDRSTNNASTTGHSTHQHRHLNSPSRLHY